MSDASIHVGGMPPADWIERQLPDGTYRHIVLKPNWVHHEVSPDFPISALVTSPALIDAVIAACVKKYPKAVSIAVGDVPLQSCDFDLMLRQSGMLPVIAKWSNQSSPSVTFRDWRRERYVLRDGFMQKDHAGDFGDPAGYRQVTLDQSSYLDPISGRREQFRVSDYDIERIQSSHRQGFHRYLVAGTVLDCDLFINLPKMKTHQKSGITGALKNLVGCNGEKAFLVHYLKGRPQNGGDEFPPTIAWPIRLQVRVREALQKRSRLLFSLLRPFWRMIKKVYGIRTEGTHGNLGQGKFYLAAGAWYGNDTIWRMVYDLNRIIRFAGPEGGDLKSTPTRTYAAILDGMVGGEGNGPLQPLPVKAGVVVASRNPFVMDAVMARLMGYNIARIPLLSHVAEFNDGDWSATNYAGINIETDRGVVRGVRTLQPLKTFTPPPGWRGHIEQTL